MTFVSPMAGPLRFLPFRLGLIGCLLGAHKGHMTNGIILAAREREAAGAAIWPNASLLLIPPIPYLVVPKDCRAIWAIHGRLVAP